MPDIALFLVASALLTIAPGPDIVYVLTRGITQGRKAGFAAALGFATGVIRSSEIAFSLVRYAGAAYLIYIGVRAVMSKSAFALETGDDKRALRTIYMQSVVGNVLNPKVTLFFLSFLPQFVNTAAGHLETQMLLLGAIFMVQTVVIFGAVALFSGFIGDWLKRKPVIGDRLNLFAGLTFIGLGIRVALPDR
jgi:threonine/homoserine/homoserine lactone efflux protein